MEAASSSPDPFAVRLAGSDLPRAGELVVVEPFTEELAD
jgi:hypothetical protein